MFTGLIETTGTVVEVRPRTGSKRLAIASDLPPDSLRQGDSVAVDGVCLTVSDCAADRMRADVVRETLARTTLGALRRGASVNLERSLRVGDRLGGHWVQGHVDGVTRVEALHRAGDDYRLRLRLPAELARFVALKGSIAVHGVSLTVAALLADSFEVALVPATLERTTLGRLRPGDSVNLEVDLLARYLDRLRMGSNAGA